MQRIIEDYIKKIDLSDINNFALKNGVFLNDDEVNLIYFHVKNNWKTIIYGNPREVLDDLKNKLSENQYQKIENLYIYFKNRYNSFLRH